MPSIAITGGIATGKSVVTTFLTERMNATVFYADQEVSYLLDHDSIVAQEIMTAFGPGIYNGQKKADRVYLRARLIEDPKSKKKLEEILHPRLRDQWMPQAKKAKGEPHSIFLAEIPLLYENDLAGYFDHVIVVAASQKTQLQRLITHRKLSSQTASALLQLQLPLIEKINRADQVIWNDGSMIILQEQVKIALSSIVQLQNSFLPQP